VDQIDMQSNEELKTSVQRTMERLAAGKQFVFPVRWIAAHGHPHSQICDSVRAKIAAIPIEQRGEFVVEGDWIELQGANGHRAEGRVVLADRGDRLQIHFDHCMATVEINAQGQLLHLGAEDGIIARHEPTAKAIVVRSDEFHSIRFRRVIDLLAETRPSMVSEGPDLAGAEEFDRGVLAWKLSLEAPELVAFLEEHIGSDALRILHYHLRWHISEALARAVDHAALSGPGGARVIVREPALQPRRRAEVPAETG